MQKRWKSIISNEHEVEALQNDLKINTVLCKILAQRGFNTFDKAKHFFRPSIDQLHSPWLMKDMQKAIHRIQQAFENNEHILIYGDYDVDGTTSVATVYQFLKEVYPNVEFYIPHRYREGYGISKIGIDAAKEKNITLIISLDCGIKSVELIAYAKTLSIDFIVCDHHMPDDTLPDAVAILNPKQKDCNYPYKELCGCGVGFKFITALAQTLSLPDSSYLCYLDLVATAIAADIVPITGENRTLAYFGLKKVNEDPCSGIKSLMVLAKADQVMHITNLVFMIAPRVNAAGRMDDARKAVELFIEKDCDKAEILAKMLHNDNLERRIADSTITEEALAIIEGNKLYSDRKSTVIYQEHWHKGVVGIVASRLIETYYRPTIVLTRSGDFATGSARSVSGFNLYEAIHACREHLIGYGGHFAAAGMTLLPANVEAFSNQFEQVVRNTISDESLIPEIIIDAEVSFADLKPSFFNILNQMEPYGPENMRPVFIARNVINNGKCKVVKDSHIRFVLNQNKVTFCGIGFHLAEKFHLIEQNAPLDIVFTLEENNFNGDHSLQLKVIDLALTSNSPIDYALYKLKTTEK